MSSFKKVKKKEDLEIIKKRQSSNKQMRQKQIKMMHKYIKENTMQLKELYEKKDDKKKAK